MMQIISNQILFHTLNLSVCSAGVGRTGTFIALDYLLEQAKAEGMVDVFTYTALMRTNRMKMIQTLVSSHLLSHPLL